MVNLRRRHMRSERFHCRLEVWGLPVLHDKPRISIVNGAFGLKGKPVEESLAPVREFVSVSFEVADPLLSGLRLVCVSSLCTVAVIAKQVEYGLLL